MSDTETQVEIAVLENSIARITNIMRGPISDFERRCAYEDRKELRLKLALLTTKEQSA